MTPRDRCRPHDAGGASGGQRTTTVLWTPRAGNRFKPLKDPQTFDRVRLAFGVPSWPGDIDIAAERVRSDMQII